MSNLSNTGLTRVLTYLKTWITGLLSGKSDTSHTHSDYIPNSGTTSITGTGFFKSTSDSQLQIGSGTSTTTGGCFIAYGSDYSNSELAGSFRLRARTTANYDLIGYANGTLSWCGKNIDCVEEQGNNYIRYASGLQICWGEYSRTSESNATINFPKAFAGHSYPISVSVSGQSTTMYAIGWAANYVIIDNTNMGCFTYTAIGRWK